MLWQWWKWKWKYRNIWLLTRRIVVINDCLTSRWRLGQVVRSSPRLPRSLVCDYRLGTFQQHCSFDNNIILYDLILLCKAEFGLFSLLWDFRSIVSGGGGGLRGLCWLLNFERKTWWNLWGGGFGASVEDASRWAGLETRTTLVSFTFTSAAALFL